MTDLSPAAQAIWDAFNEGWTYPMDIAPSDLAAALRTAALYTKRDRLILLSIADELTAPPHIEAPHRPPAT